jgi:hypothetical protein
MKLNFPGGKKMKKISRFSLISVFILLFLSFGAVSALGDVEVSVTDAVVSPGQQDFTVDILLNNQAPALMEIELNIGYDSNVLTFKSGAVGDGTWYISQIDTMPPDDTNTQSAQIRVFLTASPGTGIEANKAAMLARLTFDIAAGGFEKAEYPLMFLKSTPGLSDVNGESVYFTGKNGAVLIPDASTVELRIGTPTVSPEKEDFLVPITINDQSPDISDVNLQIGYDSSKFTFKGWSEADGNWNFVEAEDVSPDDSNSQTGQFSLILQNDPYGAPANTETLLTLLIFEILPETPSGEYPIRHLATSDGLRDSDGNKFAYKAKDGMIRVVRHPKVTATASPEELGIISPSGEISYEIGDSLTYTVTPAEDAELSSFTVSSDPEAALDENNAYTLPPLEDGDDITIEAIFYSVPYYIITASAGEHGIISDAGEKSYRAGETPTYTVTPDPHYDVDAFILSFAGKGESEDKTDQLTASEDGTYTYTFEPLDANIVASVSFKPKQYSITAAAGKNGILEPAGETLHDALSEPTYKIVPDENYQIESCIVNGIDVTDSLVLEESGEYFYTFPPLENSATIVTEFGISLHTVSFSVNTDDAGKIEPLDNVAVDGSVWVAHGEDQKLAVIVNEGWAIYQVWADGIETSLDEENRYLFENVTEDHRFLVVFDTEFYQIHASAGEGGEISPAGETAYQAFSNPSYTVTPYENYLIDKVVVNEEDVTASISEMGDGTYIYTFPELTGDAAISVSFKSTLPVVVTIGDTSGSPGDTVTADITIENHPLLTGATLYLEYDPDILSFAGGEVTGETWTDQVFESISPGFLSISLSGEVPAASSSPLARLFFQISDTADEGIYDINCSSENSSVASDDELLSITPDDGTVTVFISAYTITAATSPPDGGVIEPSGEVLVSPGTDQTFSLQPSEGYAVEDVLIDSVSVGAVSSYIFESVSADHSISASFALIPVPEIEVFDGETEIPIDGIADFGSVTTDEIVRKTFTIRNTGDASLTLSNFSELPDGFSMEGDFPDAVDAGDSETFDISLSSELPGVFGGFLSFDTNDSDESPYIFSLSGTVTPAPEPEIEVFADDEAISSGGETDFGTAIAGEPLTKRFTISNTGTADLILGSPEELPDGFTLSDFPQTIETDGSEDFEIQLLSDIPDTYSGVFSFGTNDGDENPYSFSISGTVAPVPEPEIEVFADGSAIINGGEADLGITVAGESVTKTFTVSNIGTADLILIPGELPDGFILSDFPGIIEAGGSENFEIQLLSDMPDTYSGIFSFDTNDSDENPYAFSLIGKADPVPEPEIEVLFENVNLPNRGTADFGVTTAGSPLTKTFVIRNIGTAELVLSGFSDLPEGFYLIGNFPEIIAARGSASFEIKLESDFPDTFAGEFSFATNDKDEDSYQIPLAGKVEPEPEPEIEVFADGADIANGDILELGSVSFGDTVAKSFIIKNKGTAVLKLSNFNLPENFTAPDFFPESLEPDEEKSFEIKFDALVEGDAGGIFQFETNDSDENPYKITITATVTPNMPPNTPILISPPDEAVFSEGPITFQSGEFSDIDGDGHAETQLGIRKAYEPAFEILTADGLTEYSLSDVESGLKYFWKVRYKDERGWFSEWSAERSFKVGEIEEKSYAAEAGETQADFEMISFPQWTAFPDSMTVFKTLFDEMTDGVYDTTMFRIATYDPNSGNYIECDDGMAILPGKAYWFFTRADCNIRIAGIPVSKTHDIEVKLDYGDGWNMVAPPNDAEYLWDEMKIKIVTAFDNDGNPAEWEIKTVTELEDENPYISKRLWRWENGRYVFYTPPGSATEVSAEYQGNYEYDASDAFLRPDKGYWIKARRENVFLIFQENPSAISWETTHSPAQTRHGETRSVADDNEYPPAPVGSFSNSKQESGSGGCFITTTAESFLPF